MKLVQFLLTISAIFICFAPAAISGGTPENVEFLYVQNSHDVSIEKDVLTLKQIGATTIYFSDRPKRLAGHLATRDFVDEWDKGENSFAANPPNATVSIFTEDEIIDIVVTLKNPRLVGDNLIYTIDVLMEENDPVSGQCTVFIDPIGKPGSPTSVAGVHRRHRKREVRHEVIQ
jgi:hypothetical protein